MKAICFFLTGFLLLQVQLLWSQQLPYKVASEYEAKIDLSFREEPSQDINTFNYTDEKKKPNGPVAYLVINFKLLVSNNEVKFRVIQGSKSKLEKIKTGEVKKIEMGFVDDLKEDGTLVQILLLDDKKKEISQILISIEKDGTFLMNGEKRGKF
ncbi:MAG: hypothetical protein HYZ44_04560 [Bacteroidetes bacterium]|nr:hypothetical protein [Bacteroidota bacterium]